MSTESESPKKIKYRLRAERPQEIIDFIAKACQQIVPAGMETTEEFPYVKFDFLSPLTLHEVKAILEGVQESRIMISTLQQTDELIIERDYTREEDAVDDMKLLKQTTMICSADFKKFFWPIKRLIISQHEKIVVLQSELNSLKEQKKGDKKAEG